MTLNELIREVTIIGRDLLPNPEAQVASAANRALSVICAEHPIIELYFLNLQGGEATELRDHFPNAVCIAEPPCDTFGNVIPKSKFSGTILTLPSGFSGEVQLSLCRSPEKISADSPNYDIDLPPLTMPLLLPLTASFVWQDENPDVAESCYREFREMSDRIRKEVRHCSYSEAYSHNGWA